MKVTRRLLASKGEARLYELVKAVFATPAATRVHLKVRLADVFVSSAPIWTEAEKSFMLNAHFDIVVTDSNSNPLFGAEFDGGYHSTDMQARRDQLKDEICRKADFPLRRVRWENLTGLKDLVATLRETENAVEKVNLLERILCLNVAVGLAVVSARRGFSWETEGILRCADELVLSGYLHPRMDDSSKWFDRFPYDEDAAEILPEESESRRCFHLLTAVGELLLSTSEAPTLPRTEEDYRPWVLRLVEAARCLDQRLSSK